jgi:nucleotide-binding universal stress UspA family protein
MKTIPYLHLDRIKTDRQLMMLLSQEVAYRYNALPVATDGNRITIAMASPDDLTASAAVSSAIGAPVCLVQADPQEINQRLAEIWPQNPAPRLRLLIWTPKAEIDPPLRLYAQAVSDLLEADLKQMSIAYRGIKSLDAIVKEAEDFQPDLIILQIPPHPLMKSLLIDFAINKLIDQLSASILVVKNPRWPLQKILLAIRDGNEPNEVAIDWVLRLAHCSHASVTLLPLMPPVPLMYGSSISYSLPSLLKSNDPLGVKLRWIAQRLTTEEVGGTFKIRDGSPLEQLRCEVSDGDTDLIVIEAEPQNHLWRWLLGELVNDLFVWLDRPLLITKI